MTELQGCACVCVCVWVCECVRGVEVLRPHFPLLNLLYRVTQNQTVTHPRGKLFSPPAVRVASVLLAQLFLTIKSVGFKSSGRICFIHFIHQFCGHKKNRILNIMWNTEVVLATCSIIYRSRCVFAHLRPSYFPLISIGWENFWQSASLCINTEHLVFDKPPWGNQPW